VRPRGGRPQPAALASVAKGNIILCGVRFEEQLADIFTKPLDENTFCRLRSELNVLDASNIM
jgi:hypothetical protein